MLVVLLLGVALAFQSMACVCVGCGNGPARSASGDPAAPSAPPPIPPNENEQRFSTADGWSFLAPKELERSTAPGTTGFAVFRPPPKKPILNIVLTTEPFDGNVSAFVDKERAKIKVVKEQSNAFGIVIEETWDIGGGEHGVALVLLAVQHGTGVRLACLGSDASFDSQRPICERAIASLNAPAK